MYDIQSIRRANPITDVITNSGVELRRSRQRLVGRCPFHTDAQPSLVVYPEGASYFCFGCSAGGDVIDFVSRLNGVGLPRRRYRCCRDHPLHLIDATTLASPRSNPGSGQVHQRRQSRG